jgi:chorismate mutase/prephenate dehydratase
MDEETQLTEYRQRIDALDQQLLELLNERARMALKVGIAKGGKNIRRPEREAEVLHLVTDANKGPLADEAVRKIFEDVIEVCRTIQYNK